MNDCHSLTTHNSDQNVFIFLLLHTCILFILDINSLCVSFFLFPFVFNQSQDGLFKKLFICNFNHYINNVFVRENCLSRKPEDGNYCILCGFILFKIIFFLFIKRDTTKCLFIQPFVLFLKECF